MYGRVGSLHLDLFLGQTPGKSQPFQKTDTVILFSLTDYKDLRLHCMSETVPMPLPCFKECKKDVSMCEVCSHLQ